jgi:HEPN domain-containing protein
MNGRADLAKAWFAKGASDLTAARVILSGSGPYDTACFHCQQAVEKYMKGFLAFHGREFPFTHDLDELAKLCDEIDPSLNLSTPEVISLTDYAVRLRYDNDYWPTKDDAESAFEIASRVQEAVIRAVGSL